MDKKLLDDQTSTQIKELLNDMKNPISIMFFTKDNCEHCDITKQLFTEIEPLNEKITLKIYDFNKEQDIALKYNITDAPSYLLLNDKDNDSGFKFYGVPAGHEINTLLTQILDVSGAHPLYEDNILKTIAGVDKDINIKVFVTTSCPHCPGAAINASRLSILNPKIKAEIYEAATFNDISNKYQVSGVPKIVINETESLMGNQPINAYLDAIKKL